ncbi:AAA-like domain-containing protein [Anabaena sp. UHCC 0204]|uniref:AAA-like domain-containing protein n=1 Tax=Anabaena sp. UHCC 0204 TaxID=2590009 RepID=UPI001448967B|nr:AAA-like domain-containing protein [Anabaena sp. UHCC 0204]MTJ06909.1 diguanylate cyclase [Anabaena sp. UHCC 0204]
MKKNITLPGDPLPSNSRFYIERPPIESDAYTELLKPGSLIRIKAPRHMGKSSLMLRLIDQAQTEGYSIVTIDFKLVDRQTFFSLNNFLRWFCANVARKLSVISLLDDYWDEEIGSKVSASIYFESYLLEQIQSPLVLILHEIDYIFEHQHIAQDFLLLLRSWHEQAKQTPIWEKVRLVLLHSTEVYIPLNINQSPFNVGLSLKLPEFTVEQVTKLAKQYEIDWFDSQAVEKLMNLVGGHPYLIHQGLYYLYQQKISLPEILDNCVLNNGIYSEYLRSLLNILQKNPELSQAYNQIVNSTDGNIYLSTNLVYKLDSLGLIKLNGEKNYQPFCEMYRLFFQQNLFIDDNNIRLDKLKKENEQLQVLVNIDQLTQIANRKCFDENFKLEWQRMANIQEPLSLILADVDEFKFYNDTYGHQSGDDCLRQVAQAINSVIKDPNILVARYGGEEFALILPQTEAEEAIIIAEEIRETVKSLRINISGLTNKTQAMHKTRLTISLGIVCVIPSGYFSITEFFEAADQALYQAKQLGRDRTILSSKFKFGYYE